MLVSMVMLAGLKGSLVVVMTKLRWRAIASKVIVAVVIADYVNGVTGLIKNTAGLSSGYVMCCLAHRQRTLLI